MEGRKKEKRERRRIKRSGFPSQSLGACQGGLSAFEAAKRHRRAICHGEPHIHIWSITHHQLCAVHTTWELIHRPHRPSLLKEKKRKERKWVPSNRSWNLHDWQRTLETNEQVGWVSVPTAVSNYAIPARFFACPSPLKVSTKIQPPTARPARPSLRENPDFILTALSHKITPDRLFSRHGSHD